MIRKLAALFISLVVLIGICWTANADIEGMFRGYARSNFQVGKNFVRGEPLNKGFMPSQRSQEGQYFEVGFSVKPVDTATFNFLMGHGFDHLWDDRDTVHYSNDWHVDGSRINIRELWLQLQNKGYDPDFVLWAGSRMYRGDDIYLYDEWIVDSHNFYGLGFELLTQLPFRLEAALGVKRGMGGKITADDRRDHIKDGKINQARNTQRYIFIVKPKFHLLDFMSLDLNLEAQTIPSNTLTYTHNVAGDVTQPVPSAFGLMGGATLSIWADDFWRKIMLNYGMSDVIGGLHPRYTPDTRYQTAGQPLMLNTRRNSGVFRFGTTGVNELGPVSLMLAALFDWYMPRDSKNFAGLSLSGRPIVYLSDQWHLGFDATLTFYIKRSNADDINYLVLTPMVKYAMDKTFFGVPYIFLRFANAFYFEKAKVYGSDTSYAYNISAGFELWF